MDTFPHFHWIALDGVIPNISENFIRELLEEKKDNNNNNIDPNTNLKLNEEKEKIKITMAI